MKEKLIIQNLTKMFSKNNGVENLSFSVMENELLTLLGPSGCGKTTIMRSIGGFNKVDSGKIILDGVEIQNDEPENRPTGMVFQSYNLWPHMTVYENMAFGLKIRKFPNDEIDTEIKKMLELVRMKGFEKHYPTQLSGGQQQRIAIARSLVLKPSVLLLDEPFSALDAKIRLHMREELRRIQREANLTIIFVTHDQEEALSISDRIAVMNKGKLEQIDEPNEIYNRPKTRFVAEFIGSMNFIENGEDKFAVRPEDIKIEKSDDGKYEIKNIMALGHYSYVMLDSGVQELKVFIQKEDVKKYKIGNKVNTNIAKEKKLTF